ncbi:DUF4190 domain-containing protein [candidate division WOR-3 bacterium]|nr:DUF4190 domain-containing protein [candidate division WOR-3 bacterium]
MNCFFHEDIIACDQCSACGKKICHLCREEVDSKVFCKECFEKKFPLIQEKDDNVPEKNIESSQTKQQNQFSSQKKYNDLAIVSFSLSVASIFFHVIGAIPAIVTGVIARNQIKKSDPPQKGDEFALAGIIIGSIFLAMWSTVICIYVSMYGSFVLTMCTAFLAGVGD